MRRIHIGLNLKYEAAEFFFLRRDLTTGGIPRAGRRRILGHGIEQIRNTEIIHGRTEEYRGHISGEIGIKVEMMTRAFYQFHLLAQLRHLGAK